MIQHFFFLLSKRFEYFHFVQSFTCKAYSLVFLRFSLLARGVSKISLIHICGDDARQGGREDEA